MIKSYSVIDDHDGMRIDRWIKKNIQSIPQSLIERFLRSGKIKLNDKKVKSNFKIKFKDNIKTYDINIRSFVKKKSFIPSSNVIEVNEKGIVYNCEDYLIINKQSGIAVQGGTKSYKNLVDIYSKSKYFDFTKPYTVHRIDKETSGILIFAKNRKTAQLFTSLFRLRKVYKTYLAVCYGEMEKLKGIWTDQLIKYEGKKKIIEKAITYYKVLDKNSRFSLVEFKPITGRKHQLRKQSFNSGFPIVGDSKYSFKKKDNKKLLLHAYDLKFIINNQKYSYNAKIPDYFEKFINSNHLSLK